tara:strand:+ start:3330 stop:4913 length:1584 start_codon:yes stop_codon:yes gene_type:complete
MNICLIEPSKFVSITNFVSTVCMPPIGLSYIAAALRQAGHQVTLIDGPGSALTNYFSFRNVYVRGLDSHEVVSEVPCDVQVIGLGCMFSSNWIYVRELIKVIRKEFPSVFIILGGEHVTGFPEFSLKQAPFDVAVLGEGEETVDELIRYVEQGKPLMNVKGIAFRDSSGQVKINERRPRIRDIDSIPLPAWDLFKIESYIQHNQPHGSSQGRFIPMIATRGCPFQCTFCTNPNMWTTRWIPRNYKKIVDEMQLYQEKYNITDFQFEDLTALVRSDWIIDFCDEIISRNMKITFQMPAGTRSECINYEVALKLKKAGCHELSFAPESGDPRVLKAIKKRVNLNRMFKSARETLKAGINVGCFFIIGFPEDSYASILRTYAAIIKCALIGFTNANLNSYSPQPNTESFRNLQENGVISELSDDYLMSLFTFQDFGARKKSFNPKFNDYELSFLVIIGEGLFYIFYFLRKPQRILFLIRDLFSETAENKSSKILKSALKDCKNLFRLKLRNFFNFYGIIRNSKKTGTGSH